jgi:hypothetical protein
VTEREVGERRWEVGDRVVETVTKFQVGERKRERVCGLVEIIPKNNVR